MLKLKYRNNTIVNDFILSNYEKKYGNAWYCSYQKWFDNIIFNTIITLIVTLIMTLPILSEFFSENHNKIMILCQIKMYLNYFAFVRW